MSTSSHTYTTVQKLAAEAIGRLKERLTDEVFLIIQNDRDLMADYLYLIGKDKGDDGWKTVNMAIGKAVKQAFPNVRNKKNTGTPTTILARSYTEFE